MTHRKDFKDLQENGQRRILRAIMLNHKNRTPFKGGNQVKRIWFVFDAAGKTLGRLASEITKVLRGKHRADFTPFVDTGDGVIIINAERVKVTGNKEAQKLYRSHSGYIGSMRETSLGVMRQKKPTYILEHAVRGMMPKTRLSRAQLKRLRIFAGVAHKMDSQNPVVVNI